MGCTLLSGGIVVVTTGVQLPDPDARRWDAAFSAMFSFAAKINNPTIPLR
jgi:hypothetical protein